ncbi:hypothetical protein QF001_000902 [Paraburkholderia youngii]|uniref:hypothetical protein n=1 Tax=Paraburkholderia youngii TaxID=2782701 RepID=UPI003D260365
MTTTDWYEPHQKPVRVGEYQLSFVDCGWTYEWAAWWDGSLWRDKEGGNSLMDQAQVWRGLAQQTEAA